MNIKELFIKIQNEENVPEWISIDGTHQKFGRYSIDGMSFHFNKKYKTYYLVDNVFYSLNGYLKCYKKEVYEQFNIKECIISEEQKQKAINMDKDVSALEDIGMNIIRDRGGEI